MLHNTLYQLTVAQKLTIGYFGGSITEGQGTPCYREMTADWFRETFPAAKIKTVQAAIGGTGTSLGVYRCDRDLLAFDPDLVFFEFAVNDNGSDYWEIMEDTEAIFRKIFAHNPYADIIVIYTATQDTSQALDKGMEYTSRSAHSAVAHAYGGILQIDAGEALRHEVLIHGGDWTVYEPDTVHANTAGHWVYTHAICPRILEAMTEAKRTPRTLPEPMFQGGKEKAHLLDAWELNLPEGWQKVDAALCGRYPHFIASDTPGATLTFTFTGRHVGLYWMMAHDSGDLLCSIDGCVPFPARAWDRFCPGMTRASGHMLASGLEMGAHTVTLTVADTKAEASEGHAIRIGAIMVG